MTVAKQYIVIPARYDSSRLPGKPLADIDGIPMILRVVQRLEHLACEDLVVAVDDARVEAVVKAAGYSVVMTGTEHNSGSDRVMEAATKLGLADDDVLINVQGDEPLIPGQNVAALMTHMRAQPGCQMATLCEPLNLADFTNTNIVKVVQSHAGKALYFSRAPIPFPRDAGLPVSAIMADEANQPVTQQVTELVTEQQTPGARRHVGVYAFRVSALKAFTALGPGELEQIEMLEQLRWLQAGEQIDMVECVVPSAIGVDTETDRQRVEALIIGSQETRAPTA